MDYSQAFKFPLALEIRARFFRFLPETSAGLACMRVELYGYEGVQNVPFYANYFIYFYNVTIQASTFRSDIALADIG